VLFNSLYLKQINSKYPYPQCVITPVVFLLVVIIAALPPKIEFQPIVTHLKNELFQLSGGILFNKTFTSNGTIPTDSVVVYSSVDAILERTRKLLGFNKNTVKVNDVWEQLRKGFDLTGYEHPRVDAQLNWYAKNQRYLDRVTDRGAPYIYFILKETERRGVPTEIALLPIVESAFQPFAFSAAHAAGIWQFIPATGKRYGLKQNWWYDGRRDIYASTHAALDFLQDLHRRFNGDWLHALAAYNSGGGTVSRAIRRNAEEGKPTNFWALKLPKETRDYVPKLLAISALIAEPEFYNIKLKPLPYIPYFQRVAVKSQIELAKAAELADISIDEMYRLNPAFNRWATAPQGPHHLLVPYENVDLFRENLARYKPEERIQWKRHIVKNGESLQNIAKAYGTSAKMLVKVNKLNNRELATGKNLVIPAAPKKLQRYQASRENKNKNSKLTTSPKQKITHTVSTGDTLWGISQEYNVSMNRLASWNNMDQDDVLIAGKKLVVHTNNRLQDSDLLDALIPATFSAPLTHATTRRVKYRVRSGDSLATISQRFNVTVNQLVNWNNSVEGETHLRPGQYLTLFVDVTRQSENI